MNGDKRSKNVSERRQNGDIQVEVMKELSECKEQRKHVTLKEEIKYKQKFTEKEVNGDKRSKYGSERWQKGDV